MPFLILFFFLGCDSVKDTSETVTSEETDVDNDGFSDDMDCDDQNPLINPGMPEYCNNIDDNCDGIIDENAKDAATYYLDSDQDGYGTPLDSISL